LNYECKVHGTFTVDELGRPFFINRKIFESKEGEHLSGINWLKSFFKRYPKIYYTIWHVFCPVLMLKNGPNKMFRLLSSNELVLDVGSGPERLGDRFINLDVFPFPEVDIVADAEFLPFKDDSVEAIVSESMIEHVPHPLIVAKEMSRVLKKGGILYVSAPFITPYHASPDDFNRWTTSGLAALFPDIEIIEKGVRSGPWSALLMFLAYWFGVVFSFGSRKAAPFLAHMFMLNLGPFKFLDFIFSSFPGAEAVAAQLYIMGRKK
jgi:SAM-dependent methyltransferase